MSYVMTHIHAYVRSTLITGHYGDKGWYPRKRTNFDQWFDHPAKYGMQNVNMSIHLLLTD